jgi:hypothetical protein
MKKGEIIIATLYIIALVLNLLLIPGGVVLTVLTLSTLSTLSVLYMYLSFALFNGIRLRKIFKKDSYKGISAMRIVGAVGTGLALSMTTIGLLFKIQSWPGASFILGTGLVGLLIVTIIGTIKYLKNKSEFYTRIFKRIAVFGALGLILMLIPKTTWVEIKYRNHSAYVDALEKALADPDNKELWNRVEEERQNMNEEK